MDLPAPFHRVYQRRQDDCTEACVASILGLQLDEVIDLDMIETVRKRESWTRKLDAWLATRGLMLLWVDVLRQAEAVIAPAGVPFLVAVPSVHPDYEHMTVWAAVLGEAKNELVHDPNPEPWRAGGTISGVGFIVARPSAAVDGTTRGFF